MLTAVKIWILFSSFLVASGWILSAFHQLNRLGYAGVFCLGAVILLVWRQKTNGRPSKSTGQLLKKFQHRFKRPAPLLFLILAVFSLVAGALYVPINNDSNEYRIPRIWHWLAEGRWHWIHTLDFRMNVAGCNFEWLVAPFMLFTRYDRCLFLINCVSYLLLPGLIFSVFTRLKVRPRVAWWWMWLLSSGWCYVMQAGSEMNDSFAVIYALASVDFALRARETKRVSYLWLSLLAVALLTGAKQTDLPLVLPWLAAFLPGWRLLKNRVLPTVAVCAWALLISAATVTCLNLHYAGSWLGVPANSLFWNPQSPSPVWAFIGNAFCIPLQNLMPPYFPISYHWNAALKQFVQTPFGSHFQMFEHFGFLGQGAAEGNSGVGLWISILAAISLGAAIFYSASVRPPEKKAMALLRWIPFLSLLVFMARVVTFQNARQLAAYYIFLFPAILVTAGQARLVRKKWWQGTAVAAMVLTVVMLVIARNRPLFPAITILQPLTEKHPHWHFLARAWSSYACRLSVEDQRKAFRNTIPPTEHVLGYATVRGAEEPGQWVPFERRRVERVLPSDSLSMLQARGIHFVLVDSDGLGLLGLSIAQWTRQFNGTVVDTFAFEANPGTTATDYLVKLSPPSENPAASQISSPPR